MAEAEAGRGRRIGMYARGRSSGGAIGRGLAASPMGGGASDSPGAQPYAGGHALAAAQRVLRGHGITAQAHRLAHVQLRRPVPVLRPGVGTQAPGTGAVARARGHARVIGERVQVALDLRSPGGGTLRCQWGLRYPAGDRWRVAGLPSAPLARRDRERTQVLIVAATRARTLRLPATYVPYAAGGSSDDTAERPDSHRS